MLLGVGGTQQAGLGRGGGGGAEQELGKDFWCSMRGLGGDASPTAELCAFGFGQGGCGEQGPGLLLGLGLALGGDPRAGGLVLSPLPVPGLPRQSRALGRAAVSSAPVMAGGRRGSRDRGLAGSFLPCSSFLLFLLLIFLWLVLMMHFWSETIC